ncbi:MAG: FAD-binding oxidoreductase [Bryobacterales bacterium]|nr:FAD-binding oxidoreductase [Bryobacterales bacterium]
MQPIRAVTTSGEEILLSDAAVAGLRASLKGELLRAEDPGYDEGRALWNALHDRRPAAIVRCAGAGDAVAAMNFARTHRIAVAVRGGGHNVAGTGSCDGGIQLDLSRMKGIRIEPSGNTATVEPGVTWAEFDREAQAFGLATTGGICSQAGVAGVTLGGGFGWLMRKHGLALDNLLALEVVTADGEIRRASASENPDLFFGLRGSQSNLGIVTLLEFRLHAVGPTVLAGMVLHPLDGGKDVLRFYRDFTRTAPEELSTWAALLTAPDGSRMAAILACYAGDLNEGEGAVAPLRAFGPPAMDMLQPMPYVQAQSLIDQSFPHGRFNYWKSSLLNALSDEAIDALVDGYGRVLSPYSSVLIEHLGGAVNRVRPDETAFPHRTAAYDAVIMPMWTNAAESEANIGWADEMWQALQPSSTGGVYVNYVGSEGDGRIEAAYGTNFARLTALKSKYDPGNLLCWNQNIKPR